MTIQQNIAKIFSNLHDGVIEGWSGNSERLTLRVGCRYLAELMDKSFSYFFIEVIGISRIEFAVWADTHARSSKNFTELHDIFGADLEILSADIKDDSVLIACMHTIRHLIIAGATWY